MLTYRILQIQTQDAVRIYSPLISFVKFTLLALASGSGYAAVRFERRTGLALGFIGSSCIVVIWIVLSVMAGLNVQSTKLLQNMTDWVGSSPRRGTVDAVMGRKWFRKSAKSLRPLRVGILKFYIIEKASLLIVLKIVIDSIVFLLFNY